MLLVYSSSEELNYFISTEISFFNREEKVGMSLASSGACAAFYSTASKLRLKALASIAMKGKSKSIFILCS